MRHAAIIVLAVFAASAVAAPPEVTPPLRLSPDNVRQICQAVSRVTPQPVRSINPVSSDHDAPGVITEYASLITGGSFKRVKVFWRTDRVGVKTGYKDATSGNAYELQKIGGTWKVLPGKGP